MGVKGRAVVGMFYWAIFVELGILGYFYLVDP